MTVKRQTKKRETTTQENFPKRVSNNGVGTKGKTNSFQHRGLGTKPQPGVIQKVSVFEKTNQTTLKSRGKGP